MGVIEAVWWILENFPTTIFQQVEGLWATCTLEQNYPF